jgi:chromosome segregation ATPase
MSDEKECIDMKVDVGVLKTQVSSLTVLCDKMDKVIDRLMDNHDRVVNQIYNDMEKRKSDTVADIKEMHSRISTVDRNLSDKIELTERRIMEEIKSLRADISKHNKEEDSALKKILEWKWFVTGGVVIFAWLVTNVNLATLGKLFN